MLEKDSESAGKCDNNERKWCKNERKMKEMGKLLEKYIENAANQRKWCKKETGKNLGKID